MNDAQWPDYEKAPDSEEFRKMFVGGLDSKTTEETLKDYFSSYGEIENCEIMKDRNNPNKSKGFGFVTFKNKDNIDEIQKNRPHDIDGKKIETKRATPKQQQYWATKKLYIRNFPKDLKEDELTDEIKDVFSSYGKIVSVKLIKDKEGKDSSPSPALKGFGFIEFDDEDPVDKCNLMRKFKVKGYDVHVSKAYPQEQGSGRGRGNNYYYEYDMYGYDYYQPQMYRGGPQFSGGRNYNGGGNGGGGGRGGFGGYGYDYYPPNRNYSRGGGGGGRPFKGNRY